MGTRSYQVQFFAHENGDKRRLIAQTVVLAASDSEALAQARSQLQRSHPEVATCKYFSVETQKG